MARPRKRISAQEASRLLGVTGEAVRRLGKVGMLSYVDVNNPGNKPTRYYFKDEVVARKKACGEYTSIADDTQAKLDEAKRLNKEAALIEVDAQKRFRAAKEFPVIIARLCDILEGCFLAVEKVHPLSERERQILTLVIRMRPLSEISRSYGLSSERVRQICVKAVRRLLRGKAIAEECQSLRENNKRLLEENSGLQSKNQFLVENSTTLSEDNLLVLSDFDYSRRCLVLSDISALDLSWMLKRNLSDCGFSKVMEIVTRTREELKAEGVFVDDLDVSLERHKLGYNMNLAKLGIGNKEQLRKLADSEIRLNSAERKIKNLLLQRLDDWGLSVRVCNCLRAADIVTFADLVQYKRDEIVKFRNFGRRSFGEVEYLLKKLNLRFGMVPQYYGIVPSKKYIPRW